MKYDDTQRVWDSNPDLKYFILLEACIEEKSKWLDRAWKVAWNK